jgi:hypothetical protein
MSIFTDIMNKIFHHPKAAPTPAPVAPAPAAQPQQTPAAVPTAAPAAAPAQPVDVEAVLSAMAAEQGGGGNWRSSIVDLLKLLDLDSSLAARSQLASELGVRAGANGSGEENIALQKAVMQKLAENGGKVPDALRG